MNAQSPTQTRYFQLFATCIPVKGATRSTICDLQRNRIELITNSMYAIIQALRNESVEAIKSAYNEEDGQTIDSYLDFLEQKELGFWTTSPELFPDLDLKWESPSQITNAVIDVNEQSQHNYPRIFRQLESLGCEFGEIRLFDQLPEATIQSILTDSELNSRFRGIHLYLPFFEGWTPASVRAFLEPYRRVQVVVVHSATTSAVVNEGEGPQICFTPTVIDSNAHCGLIHPDFFRADVSFFTESQQFNSCLNRKISIDTDGAIKNCPSMPESFGHVDTTDLQEALLKKEFQRAWSIHKEQIEVCRDCEFRHVCSDCRAFVTDPNNRRSKPLKCQYDPYTATWKKEENPAEPNQQELPQTA